MKKQVQIGLTGGIASVLAIGALEVALAKTENDFFQFCTTKAYGWPAPWKIEYCECEGAETVYPAFCPVVNVGAVGGGGVAGFVVFGGFALLRQRKD